MYSPAVYTTPVTADQSLYVLPVHCMAHTSMHADHFSFFAVGPVPPFQYTGGAWLMHGLLQFMPTCWNTIPTPNHFPDCASEFCSPCATSTWAVDSGYNVKHLHLLILSGAWQPTTN